MESPEQRQPMVETLDKHFQDRMAVDQARRQAETAQTKSERIIWENRVKQRIEALERRMKKK